MMMQQKQQPQQSLLEMWTGQIERRNASKHVPFAGTRSLGEKAKLYLNFETRRAKEQQQQAAAAAAAAAEK